MQLQLTKLEIGEYAKLKTKLFANSKFLKIDDDLEADPDYHRYVVLNRKLHTMYKFWRRLNDAPPGVYIRVQKAIERRCNGYWIRGFSPGIGLLLD